MVLPSVVYKKKNNEYKKKLTAVDSPLENSNAMNFLSRL